MRSLLLAVTLAGCGVGVPQPSSTVIDSTVIDWALGSGHLGNEPPPGDRYLLVVDAEPSAGVPEPDHPKCLKATSFVPAPDPDSRIFVLLDGQLHSLATPNSDPKRLTGPTPLPKLTRLLALTRPPAPLGLLVAAQPPGAEAERIWQITLAGDAVSEAGEVKDKSAFVTQEAFFRRYNAPRCQPDGKKCLVLAPVGSVSYLDMEPVRGKKPEPFKTLGKVALADYAYASPDAKKIYLLRPCQ